MQSSLSAHKLYKLRGGKHDYLKFLHDIITLLIVQAPGMQQRPNPRVDNIFRLTGRLHFPGKREYEGDGQRHKSKKKECRVCRARNIKTPSGRFVETTWVCKYCPGEHGFCVEKPCFQVYHTILDYAE